MGWSVAIIIPAENYDNSSTSFNADGSSSREYRLYYCIPILIHRSFREGY